MKYVPNQLVKLQSKGLAEQVVSHPDFDQPTPVAGDPAQELLNNLQTRPLPKSDYIIVTLEGTDPERTAKQLNKLLELFRDEAEAEKDRTIDDIQENAMASLDKLTNELKDLDKSINADLKNSKIIAPGGRTSWPIATRGGSRSSRRSRFACTRSSSNPTWRSSSPASGIGTAPRLATPSSPTCTGRGGNSSSAWRCTSRRSATFDSDPAVRKVSLQLDEVIADIKSLASAPTPEVADPYETLVGTMQEEIHRGRRQLESQLGQVQASMPEHHKFLTRLDDRKQKTERIANLHDRITNYEFVSRTQKSPVTILGAAVEPTIPVRPSRARYLAMAIVLSFGLAVGPGLPPGIPRPLGEGARAPDVRPEPAAAGGRPPDADGPRSSTGGATSGPPAPPIRSRPTPTGTSAPASSASRSSAGRSSRSSSPAPRRGRARARRR